MAIDANGDLLVAIYNVPLGGPVGVIRVDPITGEQTPISLDGEFEMPLGVAVVPQPANETMTLAVESLGAVGVPISVSPLDAYGAGDGITEFSRSYQEGATVTLSAPSLAGPSPFLRWYVDGVSQPDGVGTVQIPIEAANVTAIAAYVPVNGDLDLDGDVDLTDWAMFQQNFSGPQ